MQRSIDSDLWRPQQPRYFEPLYNAATQGVGNTAYGQSILDSTDRFAASKGYGSSTNAFTGGARALDQGTNEYIRSLTPLATGRGGLGDTMSRFAGPIAGTMSGQSGALGAGIEAILNGNQPTGAQSIHGMPRNQTLLDIIGEVD